MFVTSQCSKGKNNKVMRLLVVTPTPIHKHKHKSVGLMLFTIVVFRITYCIL